MCLYIFVNMYRSLRPPHSAVWEGLPGIWSGSRYPALEEEERPFFSESQTSECNLSTCFIHTYSLGSHHPPSSSSSLQSSIRSSGSWGEFYHTRITVCRPRGWPDYSVNRNGQKMRGHSGKKIARKSRNSCWVNGRGCGGNLTKREECLFCHIYCAYHWPRLTSIGTVFCAVSSLIGSPGTLVKSKEQELSSVPPLFCQKMRTWRFVEKTFQEKNYFLQTNVCHIRVTVDLPTFCLIKQSNTHTHTIFSVESKELELELEQPKKKSPSKKKWIKEFGKYAQKKFDKIEYCNIES